MNTCPYQYNCPCGGKYTKIEHEQFIDYKKSLDKMIEPWRQRQQNYADSHRSIGTPTDSKKAQMYDLMALKK